MSKQPRLTSSPQGLMRWFARMPIWLYRLNLGWMLGGRFMLINHIGRKSGLARQAVVEVVHHDALTGCYYVVSGWGYQSQWYQNLTAHPDVTIQVGRKHMDVHASSLPPEDAARLLLKYRELHPVAAKGLSRFMGKDIHDTTQAELETVIEDMLPVVSFCPR